HRRTARSDDSDADAACRRASAAPARMPKPATVAASAPQAINTMLLDARSGSCVLLPAVTIMADRTSSTVNPHNTNPTVSLGISGPPKPGYPTWRPGKPAHASPANRGPEQH